MIGSTRHGAPGKQANHASAARKRALRRLAREDPLTYRALYEQTRPLVSTGDQARGRALTLLRYRHPGQYLVLYAQERLGPGTNVAPQIRAAAWRKASRWLTAQRAAAYRELLGQAKASGLAGQRAHHLAIAQLRNDHQELFARLLAIQLSNLIAAASQPPEACPGCGGDRTSNWTDRSICPQPCGKMHIRCSQCGQALDSCHWDQADLPATGPAAQRPVGEGKKAS
jgi:hypothetical protein